MKFIENKTKAQEFSEELSTAIADIAAGLKALRSGNLNERAVLMLIAYASGVPQKDVKRVLDGIEKMPSLYFKT